MRAGSIQEVDAEFFDVYKVDGLMRTKIKKFEGKWIQKEKFGVDGLACK
jgi:hypothetical protein